MLFNDYPNIIYTLNNKNIELVDIFRNVVFKDVDLSNSFDEYYIQDGETPEIISIKIYGNSEYSWLILLINSIADIENEWFPSAKDYAKKEEVNFGGQAFYIEDLPDLQTGDVVVKVTSVTSNQADDIDENTYRHIESFDPYFRKIRGICGSGTFVSGNNVLFARKNDSGVMDIITFDNKQVTTIKYVEEYKTSVDYFITGNNVVLDPYRRVNGNTIEKSSVDPGTTYSNSSDSLTLNNFAKTLIYRYGASGGLLPTGVLKTTEQNTNFQNYLNKQKIKVLKPEILSVVLNALENAIKSDLIGRVIKVEI
jgi:hypothetical protein